MYIQLDLSDSEISFTQEKGSQTSIVHNVDSTKSVRRAGAEQRKDATVTRIAWSAV